MTNLTKLFSTFKYIDGYNNLSIKGGGNFVKNQLSHREVTRFPSWKRKKTTLKFIYEPKLNL